MNNLSRTIENCRELLRSKNLFALIDRVLQAEDDRQVRKNLQPVSTPPAPQYIGQEYSFPCDLCVVKDDGRIVLAQRAAQLRFSDGLWVWMENDRGDRCVVENVVGRAPTHWLAIPVPDEDDTRSVRRRLVN